MSSPGDTVFPNTVERRVYRNSPEHAEYLRARFAPNGSYSFEWEGHRWAYHHSSFDESGEFDLIFYRPAVPATPAPESPAPAPVMDEDEFSPMNRSMILRRIARILENHNAYDALAKDEARKVVWLKALRKYFPEEMKGGNILRGSTTPEVGTGSETSPDAARLERRDDDFNIVRGGLAALTEFPGIQKSCMQALARLESEAQPGEASEPEQIPTPHPVAEAEQSSPSLVWTKEKPTSDGYYWRRIIAAETGMPCSTRSLVGIAIINMDNALSDLYYWEWAGPIPEPAVSPNGNGGLA